MNVLAGADETPTMRALTSSVLARACEDREGRQRDRQNESPPLPDAFAAGPSWHVLSAEPPPATHQRESFWARRRQRKVGDGRLKRGRRFQTADDGRGGHAR